MLVKLDTSTLTDEPGGHRDAAVGGGASPTPDSTVISTQKLHHERGRYLIPPGNNAHANLAALCQRCHMLHDAAEHPWQRW